MSKNEVLAWLKRRGTRRNVEGMARYGIQARRAFGVPVGTLRVLAKKLGKDHALALELWKSGWLEARFLAAMVDDASRVTPRQMDAWAAGFENWADCDTACFTLFDRTPFAWEKVRKWARSPREFVKRGAFALLASLALHDKRTEDRAFARCLPLVERAAADERNFVKKGVSWALRAIGRRSRGLNTASVAVARRLSASAQPAARWVGKDAFRELTSPAVTRRLKEKRAK